MKHTKLAKVLSLAIRKYKPLRKDINLFKGELTNYLNHIAIAEEKGEHEENFKKYLSDFLKKSLYQDHLINTKERIDLAIYSGKDANSHISVLIEVKRPSNVNEFLTEKNINKKALQELLLYYLRERVDNKNNNIKQLIATNGYEWYLFKGEDFYTYFYKNRKLVKEYEAFRDGEKDSSKNELFYNEIAAKYIAELGDTLDYVYFNLKDFETLLPVENKADKKLVSLYKVLSSTNLLGKALGNDNNQLNKQFYGELLHIIGLEEHKDNGKKIIRRLPAGQRHFGSLLESAIFTLEDRDYLRKVPNLRTYGNTKEEQLFNVGLELCLTWINRILFIKLLEAQLYDYHQQDKKYRFLNADFIKGFDDLEALFFSALAKKHEDRSSRYQDKYQFVPYLNSSLFEPNELEDAALQISNIKDEDIALYDKTILKDNNLKRLTGERNTLYYLFDFLDAYDFSADSGEQVQEGEQSKALISASVLGLIFEKINGYKDGSFYTPSYITMYMSRETLRRAVVQKLNDHFDWKCTDFEDLKEDLKDYIKEQGKERKIARLAINKVINSLRICDPAVGSGHFLVSCLNELIAIKSELKILCDETGERLAAYIHLDNDELIVEDEDDNIFAYSPSVARTHTIQKALFHEKQTLIENCLFAVDINPNSVKICRLRLWIELLKNAYYNQDNRLQTLPNIDINIKCGNSLISRFGLEDDLKSAFKSKENPYSLKDYKNAVQEYKNTNDKNRKREIQQIIDTIKSAFTDTLDKKFIKKLANARGKYELKNQELTNLKAFGTKIPKKEKDLLKKLKKAFETADSQKKEILDNAIYENAFEWRFEFPEVLDKKGNFKGFDVVIGNPPYIRVQGLIENSKKETQYYENNYDSATGRFDVFVLFIENSYNLIGENGLVSFILPHKFLVSGFGKGIRKFLLKNNSVKSLIHFGSTQIFTDASTYTCVLDLSRRNKFIEYAQISPSNLSEDIDFSRVLYSSLSDAEWKLQTKEVSEIFSTISKASDFLLKDVFINISRGVVTGADSIFIVDGKVEGEFFKGFSKELGIDIELEKELVKPILKGNSLSRFGKIQNQLHLIYPHKLDDKTSPIEEDELISSYPRTFSYLNFFKNVLTKKKIKYKTNPKYWYALHNSRDIRIFEAKKIITPYLSNKGEMCIDSEGTFYTNDKCSVLILNDDFNVTYEYCLGVLNSRLMWFFISNSSSEYSGGYFAYTNAYLEPFPMKIASKISQTFIETRVNKILAAKEADPAADTTALEQEIDILVYKLYGLTYAEVLVVEEGFELSEAEYEGYEVE